MAAETADWPANSQKWIGVLSGRTGFAVIKSEGALSERHSVICWNGVVHEEPRVSLITLVASFTVSQEDLSKTSGWVQTCLTQRKFYRAR